MRWSPWYEPRPSLEEASVQFASDLLCWQHSWMWTPRWNLLPLDFERALSLMIIIIIHAPWEIAVNWKIYRKNNLTFCVWDRTVFPPCPVLHWVGRLQYLGNSLFHILKNDGYKLHGSVVSRGLAYYFYSEKTKLCLLTVWEGRWQRAVIQRHAVMQSLIHTLTLISTKHKLKMCVYEQHWTLCANNWINPMRGPDGHFSQSEMLKWRISKRRIE